VFVAGKDYSDLQIAVEAARLAYLRAEQSPQEKQRLEEALKVVDFDALDLLRGESTDTHAFAAYRSSDSMALIAFRGTRPQASSDLVTDLKLQLVDWPETGGRVHQGFADAFRAIRPEIKRWLEEKQIPTGRLIFSGHSLGAGLATLAASIWESTLLVTVGSPRVGNADFVATLGDVNLVRIVDCCDLITDVPPELGGYRHAGAMVYITANGEVRASPTPEFIAADRSKAERDYFMDYAMKSNANVTLRRLADHAPINYARAFFP
jgi:hypothetical protein